MKKTNLFLGMALSMMLFSCGGGDKAANDSAAADQAQTEGQAGGATTTANQARTITPNSTDFTSGQLARYIEVVDEPAEITYVKKDDYEQHIRVAVPVKLVKDGFTDVDYRDIDFTRLLSVALIKLVDANGETTVPSGTIGIEDTTPLKKLLTQNEGATATIVFDGRYANPDGSKEWYEKTVSFTPDMTAEIQVSSAE